MTPLGSRLDFVFLETQVHPFCSTYTVRSLFPKTEDGKPLFRSRLHPHLGRLDSSLAQRDVFALMKVTGSATNWKNNTNIL